MSSESRSSEESARNCGMQLAKAANLLESARKNSVKSAAERGLLLWREITKISKHLI